MNKPSPVILRFSAGEQDLPAEAYANVPADALRGWMTEPSFVALGNALPNTAIQMRSRFHKPDLLIQPVDPDLAICSLEFKSSFDASMIVAKLHNRETLEMGLVTDEIDCLPDAFKSYYQWLDGLQLVPPTGSRSLWWADFPCALSSRREVADVLQSADVSKQSVVRFYERFLSNSLLVWMYGSKGDYLFSAPASGKPQVFHLNHANPESVGVIESEGFLDAYLSSLLAHGPGAFKFEDWREPYLVQ